MSAAFGDFDDVEVFTAGPPGQDGLAAERRPIGPLNNGSWLVALLQHQIRYTARRQESL